LRGFKALATCPGTTTTTITTITTITTTTKGFATAAGPAKIRDHYGMFINGKEVIPVKKDNIFTVQNPATGQNLCTVTNGTDEDVDYACRVAHEAFESGVWSRMDVRERSKILYNMAALLRQNMPHFAKMVTTPCCVCVVCA
jgi:hypothetical protein